MFFIEYRQTDSKFSLQSARWQRAQENGRRWQATRVRSFEDTCDQIDTQYKDPLTHKTRILKINSHGSKTEYGLTDQACNGLTSSGVNSKIT